MNKSVLFALMFLPIWLTGQNYRISTIFLDNNPTNPGDGTLLAYHYGQGNAVLPDSENITYYNSNIPSTHYRRLVADPSGQYINEIVIPWVSGVALSGSDKIGYYDNQGRLNCCREYYTSEDAIEPSGYRAYYNYNANGNISYVCTHNSYVWSGNCFYSNDITCDSQGRISIENTKVSTDSSSWHNFQRIITSYYSSDTSTGMLYLQNMKGTLDFDIYSELYNAHFMKGKISHKQAQYLSGEEWLDYYHETHSYDAENRLVQCIVEELNPSLLSYSSKYDFSYDINGNLEDIIERKWNNNIQQWNEAAYSSQHFTWEEFTATEDEVITPSALRLNVYPNPFRTNVQINIQSKSNAPVKAAVYNFKGQLVKVLGSSKSLAWNGTDANNRSTAAGIYFIRAEQDGKTFSRKLVRLK